MNKSYTELSRLETFEERFKYLENDGVVGQPTFGSKRYLNQILYKTPEWKRVRRDVILRDNACDLGIPDRAIGGRVIIHHINSISEKDILERSPKIFDMENLICVSHITHEALHYGNEQLLIKDAIVRRPNDTCPWKQ